ncbi:MAG TPA: hypothetical protein PKB10_05550, partial [Tepidisphaeraceae bacterium]|nr:hypothetical protein [Tepidisphaeraceae bacterium]
MKLAKPRMALVGVALVSMIGCARPTIPTTSPASATPLTIPPTPEPPSPAPHWQRVTLGASVQGRPIDAVFFGPEPYETFIFAGIHGSERISADLADRFVALLQS